MIPASSICRKSGFTLAEAVLSVFLCSIIFAVTAVVLNNAHKILRQQRYKVAAQQGVQIGLSRICSELREAVVIDQVGNGLLEFHKVDASLNRYQSAPNFTARLRIFYQLQSNRLTRQVEAEPAQVIANEVYGFSTARLANNNIQVLITFFDTRQVRTYDTQVAVPADW